MPFGAQIEAEGRVAFRLWAPDATTVQLDLTHDHGHVGLPMQAQGDGWYSTILQHVGTTARYAFRIDDRLSVPDPASRFNPQDVHAASQVVDPCAFDWPETAWVGRPWEEAVIYELHVGTFTLEGSFAAAAQKLDYLLGLGVTAIEIMPVADFPGSRGWGYDGVLPFAPDAAYGTPDDLKRLVAEAHARDLMVFLDVVYNHFGPEGNYLHAFASAYFNPAHATPWGAAINFDGARARTVRDFFIHNALYWIDEFQFDGLRLDAIQAIVDTGDVHVVEELAAAIRNGPGRGRQVHLIVENEANQARFLARSNETVAEAGPIVANGQWNDDFHHALHVLVTGEKGGYYADYAERPLWYLGRALAEGFGYQGEPSRFRGDRSRGDPSRHLPPTAFINFTQSHDQVGNRALGERIGQLGDRDVLRAGIACLLLAPSIPMLFMGEEFAASGPFLYFCDFGPELAEKVRQGRLREFAAFGHAADIPDANDAASFEGSKLDWREPSDPAHHEWFALYRDLLALRRRFIVPHLAGAASSARFEADDEGRLAVDWVLPDGAGLALRANFSPRPWALPELPGRIIYRSHQGSARDLPPRGVAWSLDA